MWFFDEPPLLPLLSTWFKDGPKAQCIDNGHKFVERHYSISVEETKNKASFMFVLSLKLRNRVDYDSDASQTPDE